MYARCVCLDVWFDHQPKNYVQLPVCAFRNRKNWRHSVPHRRAQWSEIERKANFIPNWKLPSDVRKCITYLYMLRPDWQPKTSGLLISNTFLECGHLLFYTCALRFLLSWGDICGWSSRSPSFLECRTPVFRDIGHLLLCTCVQCFLLSWSKQVVSDIRRWLSRLCESSIDSISNNPCRDRASTCFLRIRLPNRHYQGSSIRDNMYLDIQPGHQNHHSLWEPK